MKVVLATTNVDTWALWIHDRNHFILSGASIYGSEKLDFFFGRSWYPDDYTYAVIPTETNFIDQKDDQCLSQNHMAKENLWQCLEKYRDSLMNCTLPWHSKKVPYGPPSCQLPHEYDQFANLPRRSDPYWIKNVAKCSPGCKRYGYSTKLYDLGSKKEISESMVLKLFYNQYEVPVIEHVYAYDRWNLISDFGGYLGLLLGYSILAFYDTLVFIIVYVKKTLTRKRKLVKTSLNHDELANTSTTVQDKPCQDDNIIDIPTLE